MTEKSGQILIYQMEEGGVRVEVRFESETFWMTQKAIADLFGVQVPAVAKHLRNIFDEEELDRFSTVSKMETVQTEGERQVVRSLDYVNLDAVIAVGYRVSSKKATRFRQWATKTLKEYIHFAVTGKTAAELIAARVDAQNPTMGLTNWKSAPNGKILRQGVVRQRECIPRRSNKGSSYSI